MKKSLRLLSYRQVSSALARLRVSCMNKSEARSHDWERCTHGPRGRPVRHDLLSTGQVLSTLARLRVPCMNKSEARSHDCERCTQECVRHDLLSYGRVLSALARLGLHA
jgi:hypothetical protein